MGPRKWETTRLRGPLIDHFARQLTSRWANGFVSFISMAADEGDGPRVIPGPIKGSGSKVPWIILAVLVIAGLAIALSAFLAVIVLRS